MGDTKEIVAADIGGTHARFAVAEIGDRRVVSLGETFTFKTADHADFEAAWEAFGRTLGRPLPDRAGIAVAGAPEGDRLKLTNNPWVIHPGLFGERLGLVSYRLVNDFGAVSHAVAQLGEASFRHLCGPERPLPAEGVVSVVGPGTGLGVGQLVRRGGGYFVVETEGGHSDFAPLDGVEDGILAHLRGRYGRVSVERIASGPGLPSIHEALAALDGETIPERSERELWRAAMAGEDRLASAALERFFLSLGAIAGDIALTQGAAGVVIAGGLGLRLADHFAGSGFRERFVAKGRFAGRMQAIPVKLITYPEPGLFGAAAAFAERYC